MQYRLSARLIRRVPLVRIIMKLVFLYVLLVSALVVRDAEAQGISGFFSAIANFFRRRPSTGSNSNNNNNQQQLQQQQAALIEQHLQDQVNQALQQQQQLQQQAVQQEPATVVMTEIEEVTVTTTAVIERKNIALIDLNITAISLDGGFSIGFTVVTETHMEMVTQTSLMAMHSE